jgi:hypothetical protein
MYFLQPAYLPVQGTYAHLLLHYASEIPPLKRQDPALPRCAADSWLSYF